MRELNYYDSLPHTVIFFQACESDVFPNISILLGIACTLPITSVEIESANNLLKRLKTTCTFDQQCRMKNSLD